MSEWDTEQLVADDKKYVWHPFTPMGPWCASEHEPLVLVGGEGAIVRDSRGREYIDGNSSIWTNIHGHNHPRINAAIRAQLDRVAHTSFLGTTNPPAINLAREIVKLFPAEKFGRVFFSDDGSTGIEAALRIVSPSSAPEGANLPSREELMELSEEADEIAAVVIEPIVQGAAGMKIWPPGTLQKVRSWCESNGALLIADEVMTGFGRTGKMFACEHEETFPDIYVFAKGLTGGYLPLALTLVSHEIFEPFNSDS